MYKVTVVNEAGGIEVLENRRSVVKAVESALTSAVNEYGLGNSDSFTITVAPATAQVRLLSASV